MDCSKYFDSIFQADLDDCAREERQDPDARHRGMESYTLDQQAMAHPKKKMTKF
jgi:hypothetical protein